MIQSMIVMVENGRFLMNMVYATEANKRFKRIRMWIASQVKKAGWSKSFALARRTGLTDDVSS